MIKQLSFIRQSSDPVAEKYLATRGAELNFQFPPVFIEFCSRWNGGFTAESNEFYPVPEVFEEFYEEFGSQSGGVLVNKLFGVTETFPQCSLVKKLRSINAYGDLGVIPIGEDLFGNRAVLRIDSPNGFVYWWDHDLWEIPENAPRGPVYPDRPRLIPIARDLETFYNGLTVDPDGR